MTVWPETLPAAPLVDGFSETTPETTIKTDMEQGAAKIRRRSTAAVRKLEVQYVLSQAQVGILDDFFQDTVAGGAISFTYTHPRTGAPLDTRFAATPVYHALNGDYYRVTLSLEFLP